MRYQTDQLLRVIRVEGDDWEGVVREQLESGRNFFLILPGEDDSIRDFCKSFGLDAKCLNESFTRSDLLRMGQYIDSAAFDEMLVAWDTGEKVIFLEQIDFPLNRPPHVKPFLIYSPVWGILSQHDERIGARRGLEQAENWEERTRLSQPAIYHWNGKQWKMM